MQGDVRTHKPKWTAAAIQRLLRKRYPQDAGWAYIAEVANATGAGVRRYADGVAVGLWPSRGLDILGFEIKVSRSDWKRERLTPEKAEVVAAYCDQWWIVAPEGVVPEDELPPAWGLLTPNETGEALVVKTRARDREDVRPLDRAFLAALLRKDIEQAGVMSAAEAALKAAEARREGIAWAEANANNTAARRAADAEAKLARLEADLRAFHEATGLDLGNSHWNRLRLYGPAIKLALEDHAAKARSQMESIERAAKAILGWAEDFKAKSESVSA